MKKSYDYILFDWDGCLAKTLDLILDVYRSLFLEFGLHPSDKELISIWGDWAGPKQLGISEKDLPIWVKKYKEALNRQSPFVELYDGAKEMLQKLRDDGKHLALLSSSSKNSIERALDRHNVRNFFTTFLYAEDVIHHKPDPEIIEKALQLLHGTKEKAIIIGDSKSDLGAATNAKIDSLLYFPQHNSMFYSLDSLKALKPTYIVEDFKQVFDLIK